MQDRCAEMAKWLVTIGYPYDFTTDPPVPEFLREPLVEAWWRHDGCVDSLDEIRPGLALEGGWEHVGPS
jgi:hypothetical protein